MNRTLFIKEDLTFFDRYRAAMHLMSKKKYIRPGMLASLFPVPVYLWMVFTDEHPPFIVLLLPISFLLLFYVLPLLVGWTESRSRPEKFRNVTICVSEEGFSREGERFKFKRNWPEFNGWEETGSFIYLYFSKLDGVAHIIPKRSMKEGDLEVLRKILTLAFP
ncbi:MAG: YcxB family protein [Bacteroidia bacterium]